jgi:hypothetical protein
MKKVLFLAVLVSLIAYDADAQFRKRKKKPTVEVEAEEARPGGFEVSGFARDRDAREVRERGSNDAALDGFKDGEKVPKAKKVKPTKKPTSNRNRDIETLMADLNLAKIQRPVFRGIMTEHMRDVNNVVAQEGMDNAEKNVHLKQLYVMRNKRLQETLNDEQYNKWLRIKDEDEYLDIDRPNDF